MPRVRERTTGPGAKRFFSWETSLPRNFCILFFRKISVVFEVVENNREQLSKFQQCGNGNLPYLRVRFLAAPELEEVPPFPEIAGDHDFRFQIVWQDSAGLLRLRAQVKQFFVRFGSGRNDGVPFPILGGTFNEVERPNKGDYSAVVAVPGAFLGVTGDPVPDDFVGHSTIRNEKDGYFFVLNDAFVARPDQVDHEAGGGIFGNAAFRLVADAPETLYPAEHFGRDFVLNSYFGIDYVDLHFYPSFLLLETPVK
jgi:hypothetical protein